MKCIIVKLILKRKMSWGSNYKDFVDIVTYDALACNSKFINHCIELRVDAVIRVKQNNNNAIKDIKRRVNKNVLYCIFIASNLFQLFRMRRIKNHVKIQKELIRLLLKGLYLLKSDKSLIFDTT